MNSSNDCYCIVTHYNNWYCKSCNNAHGRLYVDGNKHYCDKCAPDDVKSKAVDVNQNHEVIDK